MKVDFRLYKRFDADLIALIKADYPVATMMKDAVIGYANGNPVHYYVDEFFDFDSSSDATIHSCFIVPNTDVKTCYVLKHIKTRCRNAFVKAVLRNALVQQNIACYFSDPSLAQLQAENLKGLNIHSFVNLVPCSSLKVAPEQMEFAGQTITLRRGRPRKNTEVRGDAEYNPVENAFPYTGASPFVRQAGYFPAASPVQGSRTRQGGGKRKSTATQDVYNRTMTPRQVYGMPQTRRSPIQPVQPVQPFFQNPMTGNAGQPQSGMPYQMPLQGQIMINYPQGQQEADVYTNQPAQETVTAPPYVGILQTANMSLQQPVQPGQTLPVQPVPVEVIQPQGIQITNSSSEYGKEDDSNYLNSPPPDIKPAADGALMDLFDNL